MNIPVQDVRVSGLRAPEAHGLQPWEAHPFSTGYNIVGLAACQLLV
jgi:hypothetical protein